MLRPACLFGGEGLFGVIRPACLFGGAGLFGVIRPARLLGGAGLFGVIRPARLLGGAGLFGVIRPARLFGGAGLFGVIRPACLFGGEGLFGVIRPARLLGGAGLFGVIRPARLFGGAGGGGLGLGRGKGFLHGHRLCTGSFSAKLSFAGGVGAPLPLPRREAHAGIRLRFRRVRTSVGARLVDWRCGGSLRLPRLHTHLCDVSVLSNTSAGRGNTTLVGSGAHGGARSPRRCFGGCPHGNGARLLTCDVGSHVLRMEPTAAIGLVRLRVSSVEPRVEPRLHRQGLTLLVTSVGAHRVCVASRSKTAGMLPRRALSAGRITGLGATPDSHHELLGSVLALRTSLPA